MAGISNVCEPLHLFGEPLPVWYTEDRRYWVESRTLSQFLGYVQAGSLRKQVLHDWSDEVIKNEDYYLEHDGARIRDWEAGTQHILMSKPLKPSRGLLFFSATGLEKVLHKSTKERASRLLHLLETNELNLYFPADVLDARALPQRPQESSEDLSSEAQGSQLELDLEAPEELEQLLDGAGAQDSDRFFQYEVIQRLLDQLQELEMSALQELAIEAAEIALDRDLTDLRQQIGLPHRSSSSTSLEAAVHVARQVDNLVNIDIPGEEVLRILEEEGIPSRKEIDTKVLHEPLKSGSSEGPLFTARAHYSLSKIGHMAGGYTARAAGVAADVVAQRFYGLSHDDIRQKRLHFNQLVVMPDRRGKPRRMYRFDKDFSNKIILELRTNNAFRPETPKEPAMQPRNLSRGPFDDDGPRKDSSFLE